MGYTSYWKIQKDLDKEKFATLAEELEFVVSMLPTKSKSAQNEHEGMIFIVGGDGEGEPVFTKDLICFNGRNENDESHETFAIRQKGNESFEFWKTNRKPYDLMVCISLLRLKHHFPESKISSDGQAKDWAEAKKFYKKAFKEVAPKIK